MVGREENFAVINGSYGEGGGQILRTSLALSAILKKPVTIHHIRAKRNRPGLRPQHLKGVEALTQITQAEVKGAHLGSETVSFIPKGIFPGNFKFEVGNGRKSAGSVTLLLQTLLPPLCVSQGSNQLTLVGGTHVPWSPPFHYFSEILLPALRSMGVSIHGQIEQWGWYPKGGGIIRVEIRPGPELRPVRLIDRGRLKGIRGLSATSQLPRHVGERQRDYAIKRIRDEIGMEAEIEILHDAPGKGPGCFFFLVAESERASAGFSSLGERGKRAEKVAEEAIHSLKDYLESDACIDSHLADQLLSFMAVAQGPSSFTTHRITDHLVTNLWVVQQLMNVNLSLTGEVGSRGRVDLEPSQAGPSFAGNSLFNGNDGKERIDQQNLR